jgi:hypothetical protein
MENERPVLHRCGPNALANRMTSSTRDAGGTPASSRSPGSSRGVANLVPTGALGCVSRPRWLMPTVLFQRSMDLLGDRVGRQVLIHQSGGADRECTNRRRG